MGLPVPNRDTAPGGRVCDPADAWANRAQANREGEQQPVTCSLSVDEAEYLQQVAHTAVFGAAPAAPAGTPKL